MSKMKARSGIRNKRTRITVVLICAALGVTFAASLGGQWRSSTAKSKAFVTSVPVPVPTATPLILAKEYIYAGTRLIATEEPVINPLPALSSISPTSKTVGSAAFTLTVNGTNFMNGSVIRLNGSNRTTTFSSSTQLTAQITAADVQTAGTFPITVFNSAPGGGTSTVINLTVNNPTPTLSSISPTSKTVGSAAFTLTVNGSNFVNGSVVRFNGSDRTTTFQSATQLMAQITAADILAVGQFPITVFNPTPGGGPSGAINFTVTTNPVPALSSISPPSKFAGEAAFTLTTNGTNFVSGSVVRFNGSNRTTTFASPTQLMAQITAADIQAVGQFPITVFNPTPGGGSSGAANFPVTTYPLPTLSGISPTSKVAGEAAFTLTAYGTNFLNGSIVSWNGANRTTTFVSSTQLSAQISAADIQTEGLAGITVVNPDGGTANQAAFFTINPPPPVGYEADVAPRPNGSNTGAIGISDWVQTGRFVVGLDTVNPGNEFQRLDSAPKSSLGNGSITIADWTQAGRYAAGLDPVVPVGGPSDARWNSLVDEGRIFALALPSDALFPLLKTLLLRTPLNGVTPSIVRVVSPTFVAGQNGTVIIELDSQGNENAVGLSLSFNPAQLTFVSAVKGSDATNATLNKNSNSAGSGLVGIVIAQSSDQTFAAGTRQLVVVTFAAATSGSHVVSSGDQPVSREVADVNANPLAATFTP